MNKKLLTELGLFLSIIALFFVGFYGRPTQQELDIYKKIGRFVIKPYKYGLYITEPSSGVFYNFSPYDASYNQNGKEIKLAGTYNPAISKEFVHTNALQQKYYSIVSYFGLIQPKATFETKNGEILYTSNLQNNLLTISLNLDPPIIMSMSFNPDDVIVDTDFNLYTSLDAQEIENIEYIYNIKVNKQLPSNDMNTITNTSLVVFNKKTNGVVRIDVNQGNSVVLDNQNKLIKFILTKNQKPSIKLKLFDSLKECI